MEIVNRVSAVKNSLNYSDVIAEIPKLASENSKPMKSDLLKLSDSVSF